MGNPIPDIRWSKEQVLKAIQTLDLQGIFPSYEYIQVHDPELFQAARLQFGPWERALVSAGVIRPPLEDEDEFFDHELCAWVHDPLTVPIDRRGL